MKYKELIKSTFLRVGFFGVLLFACIGCRPVKAQENNSFFTFNPISESEFRTALKNNYNAPFVTEIADSTKLEKAFDAIAEIYNEEEKELAENELLSSPRDLTSFEAYYPMFDLYLFYIQDYHYQKACFVFASTSKLASSRHKRLRGSYGVMSKDGLWVGLERGDCDNFLQIEICKSSKYGVWSLFKFDFAGIDIREDIPALFWADKNTIYIATCEYRNSKQLFKYYSIKFDYYNE